MGAARKIPKDWMTGGNKRQSPNARMEVTRSEDLPQLMTTKEAAEFLKRHPKTIEEYRNDGSLRFTKIRGRYFTTPQWIAEFIERETEK